MKRPFLEKMLHKYILKNRKSLEQSIPRWLLDFQTAIPIIQKEWSNYRIKFQSTGQLIDEISDAQKELNQNKKWKSLIIYGYTFFNQNKIEYFPETTRLIKKNVNNITLAMFSTTEAGMHIPPHHGNNYGVLRAQLGIDISEPEKCFLRVENTKIFLKEKEIVIFDDTFEHELKNESDVNRTVLIIDFYRPLPLFYDKLNRNKIKKVSTTDYVQNVIKNW